HDDVGLEPEMLGGEEAAGPPAARLYLVGDDQDAVSVTELREALEEVGGRDDEPPLALDGLDDGRRDRCWIDDGDERPLDGLERQTSGLLGMGAPIRVRVGQAIDLGREGPESGFVWVMPAGERHREQRAAVER